MLDFRGGEVDGCGCACVRELGSRCNRLLGSWKARRMWERLLSCAERREVGWGKYGGV